MAYHKNENDKVLHGKKHRKTIRKQTGDIFPVDIFGVDEVYPLDVEIFRFCINGSRIINLAMAMYRTHDCVNISLLIEEELAYYATALFWLRCIGIKDKQGKKALSSDENDLMEATSDVEFNVPEPLYIYLSQMGDVNEMGIRAEFSVPSLPSTKVGEFGGYHAEEINEETHNLYEELPCLGIAADMIMAAVSVDGDLVPNFHIRHPVGSVFTQNLCGYIQRSDPVNCDARLRIRAWGITESKFPGFRGTRFYFRYLMSLSDYIGKGNAFNIKKVNFRRLSVYGGGCQLIKTIPVEDKYPRMEWTLSLVLPEVFDSEIYYLQTRRLQQMSIDFGFQHHKEAGAESSPVFHLENWSCIRPEGEEPWVISKEWIENRNIRRDLPPIIGKGKVKRGFPYYGGYEEMRYFVRGYRVSMNMH